MKSVVMIGYSYDIIFSTQHSLNTNFTVLLLVETRLFAKGIYIFVCFVVNVHSCHICQHKRISLKNGKEEIHNQFGIFFIEESKRGPLRASIYVGKVNCIAKNHFYYTRKTKLTRRCLLSNYFRCENAKGCQTKCMP